MSHQSADAGVFNGAALPGEERAQNERGGDFNKETATDSIPLHEPFLESRMNFPHNKGLLSFLACIASLQEHTACRHKTMHCINIRIFSQACTCCSLAVKPPLYFKMCH